MARLNEPHCRYLTKEKFELYPVWVWDDENEGYLPLTEPFTSEYGTLFIKSKLTIANHTYDGYIVGIENFYAFCLFIDKEQILMNINLPEFIEKGKNRIKEITKENDVKIFPVHYKTYVKVNEKDVCGYISPQKLMGI